jgi:hypothetical protein
VSKEIKLIQEVDTSCCAPAAPEACCEVQPDSTACCETEAASTQACCATSDVTTKEMLLWKSIGIFFALIASFVISDYWFGSYLKSQFAGISAQAAD